MINLFYKKDRGQDETALSSPLMNTAYLIYVVKLTVPNIELFDVFVFFN